MKLKVPSKKSLKFALLGSGYHLCSFAKMLVAEGFPSPIVITHPREQHKRDQHLLTDKKLYKNVFETVEDLGLPILDTPSVNRPETFAFLKKHNITAAFSLSCRSIIKKEFIDFMEGRVFNIHPSMLPAERGGGTFSWRILNGSKEVSATLHILDKGIDTGGIVLQQQEFLSLKRPFPRDYLVATNKIYTKLLGRFLKICEQGELVWKPQKETDSSYLPRLFTEVNGAIDWSWDDKNIDRFIRAFGNPYTGAFSFIDNKSISILETEMIPLKSNNHPFLKGRIIGFTTKGHAKVLLEEHLLIIKSIAVGGITVSPKEELALNKIFHTPQDILTTAQTTVPKISQMCAPPQDTNSHK